MFTVPKKLSLRLSWDWLSHGVGILWVSQMRAKHLHVPRGFPGSALAHLRGVGGSELAQPKAADGDTEVGTFVGAMFVHGRAPFHNRGYGMKDAAFSEGRRDNSSAL